MIILLLLSVDDAYCRSHLPWTLLRSFIQNNGIIGWGDQAAADNVKTQKKELIRKLKGILAT